MNSIDTNILARVLVRDDVRQAEMADRVIADGAYVPLTVLLETAWLLGSRYKVDRDPLSRILLNILDFPSVMVEREEGARWAIAQFRSGADIADAIHVAASHGTDKFVTFDRMAFKKMADPPLVIEILE